MLSDSNLLFVIVWAWSWVLVGKVGVMFRASRFLVRQKRAPLGGTDHYFWLCFALLLVALCQGVFPVGFLIVGEEGSEHWLVYIARLLSVTAAVILLMLQSVDWKHKWLRYVFFVGLLAAAVL